MARLILKSPYLKPEGTKSPGGYLKYIATREGVEMAEDTSRHLPATAEQQKQIKSLIKKHPQSKESHEYEDYIASPTRGNADAFISGILELHGDAPQRDVYLKYIDERPGSNGLFTDEGVPIVMSQVQKEMNEHPGNIWTHIISLRQEDAERLGYNSPDAWMHLLRSHRNMIAQQMKIAPENFRWYAAFHNAGHHPHVHMMAYSIKPNEPYLTEKGIETIKSNLAQEIFRQDLLQIYQKQTELRDDLRQESRVRITEIVDAINHAGIRDDMDIQIRGDGRQLLRQGRFSPGMLPGSCASAHHDLGNSGKPGILRDLIGNIIPENGLDSGTQAFCQLGIGSEPFLVFLAHGIIAGSTNKQCGEFAAEGSRHGSSGSDNSGIGGCRGQAY